MEQSRHFTRCMGRWLMSLLLVMLTSLATKAASVEVWTNNVAGAPGSTVVIPVYVTCDVDITAFMINFSTALGVTYSNVVYSDRINPSANPGFGATNGNLIVYNPSGIDVSSLDAGEGVVADIYVDIPADADPGVYTMTLGNMQFMAVGTSGSGSTIYVNDVHAYLTVKSLEPEPYACYTPSNTTLTFYYDTQRSSRTGTTYDLNTENNQPGWHTDGHYSSVTRVVFNSTFSSARPTTTHEWFFEMSNLQSITGINYLNTSEVTNMWGMFCFCESLTGLDVSRFNTTKVTDMSDMFDHCSSLTSLDLSNFNTANVIDMHYMFRDCSSLTSLDVSNFNTANVTDMRDMFCRCSGLTSLDLSNFNTAKVTNMDGMFWGCTGLTSLDVSSFNTSNVTNMQLMFDNCKSLTSLDVSNFNTANVTTMWRMFEDCIQLKTIDLSNFNTANVTDMGNMFCWCSGLTSLDLSSFNTSKVTYMRYMFRNSSNLRTIFVGGGWSTDAVTSSSDMFMDCTSLVGGKGTTYDANHVDRAYAHIDGGTSNPGYLTDAREAYACYTSSNTTLTFYYDTQRASRSGTTFDLNSWDGFPRWIDNNTNTSVTRVVFDSSFADARPTTTYRWFSGMVVLQTIEGIGFLNTSEVEHMAYMFSNCRKLQSLDIGKFNTAKVTNMSFMFGGCSYLTTLDVSSFYTAKVTDMSDMFYNCRNLRTIYVGRGWNTDAITYSSQMFEQCTNLVGCKGTTYDANHTDKAYAHIDGGTSDPGYLSRLILGDINGDGMVDVGDVTALIRIVLNSTPVNFAVADLDCDGIIDVADVTALIRGILNSTLDPDAPHNSGVWLVLLDRDGSERWNRLWQGADGAYTTMVSLYTSVYGTGRVKFYIVDNGFAYGAPQSNQAVVMGHSDSNPLSRGKNYYTVPAGYSYALGMIFDSNGQRCVYAAQGSPCN